MAIEVHEVCGPDDQRVDELLEARRAVDRWLDPDDPVVPHDELVAELFVLPRTLARRAWVALLDGEPAGYAETERELDGVNDATVWLDVRVDPSHAGRGVGGALAAASVPALAGEGCRSLLVPALDGAGVVLCRRLGLTPRQDERLSRLHVADVDEVQQARWIDATPAREAGYDLVAWTGPTPDRWVEHVCRALDGMSDAPLDDLEWTVAHWTPERVRDHEDGAQRQGYDLASALAIAPDGSPAGVTHLWLSRHRPERGRQGDTCVLPEHRGYALGRWLKAANLRQARALDPALAVVETFNAETNPHMLAINVEMGFRPYRTFHLHQAPIPTVLDALARVTPQA